MLLLFEGVDKSGKTTLIENLIKAGFRLSGYWKNPQKPKADDYWKGKIEGIYFGFYEASKRMGDGRYPFILDRSHVTEVVYAKVKRGYSSAQWLEYEKEMDALLIYVNTPLDILWHRHSQKRDDYIKQREYEVLKTRYENYLKKTKLDYIEIDGSKSELEMLQELTVKLYEYFREKNRPAEGEGSPFADVRSTEGS